MVQQNLIIHHANNTHSGTYSCEVYNIAGRVVWLESTIMVLSTE